MKEFYAVKRQDGSWVMDSYSPHPTAAIAHAFNSDIVLARIRERWEDHTNPFHILEMRVMMESAGYRCVEVELAEPGTADALKRARLAWDALVSIGARVDCDKGNAAVRDIAMQTLGEVLGRVTDTAAGEGGEGEKP